MRCTACDFAIMRFPKRRWAADVDYMFLRNNMPDAQKLSVKLLDAPGGSAYSCQCSWRSIEDFVRVMPSGELRWVCGGHQGMGDEPWDFREEFKDSSPHLGHGASHAAQHGLGDDIKDGVRRPEALGAIVNMALTLPSEPAFVRHVSPLRAFMGFFSRSHNASPASSVGGVESAVSSGRAMRDMEEGVGAIQEEEDGEVQAEGESPVLGEAETWDSCCLICFERLGPRDCMDPPKSDEGQPCDHVFCRTCCRAYLETRIATGVTFHPCPMFGPEGCTGYWREDEIAAVLTHNWVAKQQRFVTMKSCDDMRECPNVHCAALMKGDRRRPKMTCQSCGTQFCFHHANAHPPYVSCRDFVSRGRKEERLSRKTIKRIAKKCPNRSCGAPTEKNGGCNHICCVKCSYEWCWLCGGKYTPYHYSRSNILTGCPGAQYIDCGSPYLTWLLIRSLRLFMLLLVLPLPFLLGCLQLLTLSLLYLPLPLALLSTHLLSGRRLLPHLAQKRPLSLLFPLVTRLDRHSRPGGPSAMLTSIALIGVAPFLLLLILAFQLLWLPIASVVAVSRVCRRRRGELTTLFFIPIVCLGLILDDED